MMHYHRDQGEKHFNKERSIALHANSYRKMRLKGKYKIFMIRLLVMFEGIFNIIIGPNSGIIVLGILWVQGLKPAVWQLLEPTSFELGLRICIANNHLVMIVTICHCLHITHNRLPWKGQVFNSQAAKTVSGFLCQGE